MLFALAQPAEAYFPSKKRLQYACQMSGGEWQELPAFCNKMHPKSWHELTYEQQRICQDRYNEPCECGIGKRFSIKRVLGCVPSRFPEDHKPELY